MARVARILIFNKCPILHPKVNWNYAFLLANMATRKRISGMRGWPFTFLILIAAALIAFWANSRSLQNEPPMAPLDGPTVIVTASDYLEDQALRRILDPKGDGWDSEHLVELLGERFTALLASPMDTLSLSGYATEGLRVTPLSPETLKETYQSSAVNVRKSVANNAPLSGIGALRALLETMTSGVHPKAKIIGIQSHGSQAETRILVEGNSASRQFRALWQCEWNLENRDAPRLMALQCESYQEAHSSHEEWFQDRTQAAIGINKAYDEQLKVGLNEWLTRIERTHGMGYFYRHGLAVADVNGDGRDDLYACQAGGLPNLLFIQNDNGTTNEVSREAGVDWLDQTSSALFVDLDNDGDQDLVLATFEGVLVLEQHAPLEFRRRALLETKDTDLLSLSAVDVDGDALLDLYLCVDFADIHSRSGEATSAFVYHDANDGGENKLWRNEIAGPETWNFTDVTEATGLHVNNRRHSLAAAWEDVDNDGDQDLYVANDYGQNCLYRNDIGHFQEIAPETGVINYGSGMSVSWGDVNRDGFMDLYVGNMFSSAGSRIATQDRFLEGSPLEVKTLYKRFSKGNSLFISDQGRSFADVSALSDVAMGRWAWSSLFADVNNDGWEDLLVANGYITTEDTGDL
ncbi:MAG: hypothetical protein ACI8T1_001573 [Verrucomicrobiales bacterium]|jgi:hypothetical protein